MVRVTWSEEDKIISTQTGSFEIVPDKDVTNKVATDKAKYYPGEQVSIIDTVYNPSTNAIARNLSIRTVITNSGMKLYGAMKIQLTKFFLMIWKQERACGIREKLSPVFIPLPRRFTERINCVRIRL